MTTLPHHPPPEVRTYEAGGEDLVVEIEVPEHGRWVKTERSGRKLRLTIACPSGHPTWHSHADAAST